MSIITPESTIGDDNMKKGLCPRGSVGAIVRQNGQFLVLYRKSFPQGLAFVAGHGEEGEAPVETLKREVLEESGIEVVKSELVLHDTFSNPCKQGFGEHEWWVYEITEWSGVPEVREPDKHSFVRFMSPQEIASYVARGDVDPAWGQCIFPALSNILSLNPVP